MVEFAWKGLNDAILKLLPEAMTKLEVEIRNHPRAKELSQADWLEIGRVFAEKAKVYMNAADPSNLN